MTGRLLALDLVATLLVAALWLGTAAAVLAGRSRLALAALAAAELATAGRVGEVALLADAGWWFVQEKVLLTLPLVVLPGALAAVLAGPALLRSARGGTPPGPVAVAPVVGAAGGGVAGLLGSFVVGYPVTPAAALLLTLLVALPALWILPVTRTVRSGAGVLALLLATGVIGAAWWGSRLPDRIDHASGAGPAHHGVSVADLRGPRPAPGEPLRRFTLTARQADVPLAGGRTFAAWTFDGQVPGPELAVTQGDLVEVVLRNADITAGVTIHWHGYRVPAGEDGVAGVTQDAVLPGGEFTYRFRADEAGTFWYHAHQLSSEAVRRGLYGVLLVRPPTPQAGIDLAVPLHTLGGSLLTGSVDGLDRRPVPPGTPVRLRVIGTDSTPHALALRGADYRIAAVDGRDVAGGRSLGAHDLLPLAAGGRYDLVFTMPATPVQLAVDARSERGLLLSADGTGTPPPVLAGRLVDVTRYPAPAESPLGPVPRFDRDYTLVLDRTLGFLDGIPQLVYPVNGQVFPNVPDLMVREGELLRVTVVNRGSEPHPMHPHGHAALVLSRNGVPASGPLWTDSFEVGAGEVWQIAIRADNPGIWMDHCHNLEHAVAGMVLHLSYEDVSSPFAVGDATGNHPE